MAPSDEAWWEPIKGGLTNGQVRVAFRPAGSTALLDIANAQVFSPPAGQSLQIVGLHLDPDGAAIVVMRSSLETWQSVRPAGAWARHEHPEARHHQEGEADFHEGRSRSAEG